MPTAPPTITTVDDLLRFVDSSTPQELWTFLSAADLAMARLLLERVVAVINNKGGVLKTSVTTNLGGQLAEAGSRILILDMDRQGNCAQDLGYGADERNDQGLGLVQAIMTGTPLQPVREVRPNLDVVPGGSRLDDLRAILTARRSENPGAAADALVLSLAPIAHQYDVVLIDCPPGEPILQEAALGVARWLLVPTRSDASSRAGLGDVAKRLQSVRHYNPDVELLGVVLTATTQNATRIHERVFDRIKEDLGTDGLIFNAKIRYAEAAAADARERGQLVHELEKVVSASPAWYESLRNGQPVERLAGSASTLAGDYAALAAEFVQTLIEAEAEGEDEDADEDAGDDFSDDGEAIEDAVAAEDATSTPAALTAKAGFGDRGSAGKAGDQPTLALAPTKEKSA
jgi:chromosome partitioning protein